MTQRRIYQSEYPYFVTTNVNVKEGEWLFDEIKYAQLLSEVIFKAGKLKYFDVLGYQIMPDHLHLLTIKCQPINIPQRTLEKVRWVNGNNTFHPQPQSTLSSVRCISHHTVSDLLQSVKGNFSRQIHLGNIWQPRFNTRIVNTQKRLRNTIQYIKNNPIKVRLPQKYHHPPYQFFNWRLIHQLF